MELSNYHLVYNAAAHFILQEKYPGGIVDAMSKEGIAGFEATCWALEVLSTQGELVRRDMGHDRGKTIKAEKVLVTMSIQEVFGAKTAILEAITKGLTSGDDKGEVDEVLAELEKKTGTE